MKDDNLTRISENKTGAGKLRVVPTQNRWRSLRINSYLYALLGLVLLLGTCQGAKAANLWSTSGKVTSTGEKITITGANPSEIKGWMTIKEILDVYKVTGEEFFKQFNIPDGTPLETALKDIEKIVPNFSVSSVRTWLTERLRQ